jgi:hypothetical protein
MTGKCTEACQIAAARVRLFEEEARLAGDRGAARDPDLGGVAAAGEPLQPTKLEF